MVSVADLDGRREIADAMAAQAVVDGMRAEVVDFGCTILVKPRGKAASRIKITTDDWRDQYARMKASLSD